MKKIIALLLILLMLSALVGCNGEKAGTSPTPDTTGTVTDPGSTETVSSEKLKLVYICSALTNVWCADIAETLDVYSEELNYEITAVDTNRVNEKFIQLIETYCDQKVDGFILNTPKEVAERADELVSQAGIPYLFESTSAWNADKSVLMTSGTELNAYQCGEGTGLWLGDNYKEYFGEITDWSKVGFIVITYTAVDSFMDRYIGAKEAWLSKFPQCNEEDNVYVADLVSQGALSADAAYAEVSSILSGNPQVEYWMISAILDDMGQGATRAVEANGLTEKTIIASAGGEILTKEWDDGYEGCWVMCNFFQATDYTRHLAPALCAVIRGETTVEELWPDHRVEGQKYSSIQIEGQPATKDTYTEIDRWIFSGVPELDLVNY